MATNFNINDLECAAYGAGDFDRHFVEKPVLLSCSHSICKKCITTEREIVCKICNKKNEIDLKTVQEESFRAKTMLSMHFDEIFETLNNRYIDSVNSLKGFTSITT
jgi:hypothetical protein